MGDHRAINQTPSQPSAPLGESSSSPPATSRLTFCHLHRPFTVAFITMCCHLSVVKSYLS
ncbi:hypothetical protein ZOSMA_188G00010 [Zostera marina]|uniref:Uncharacterized protein n=1 Tax=Zostera marina TaxID=29655 RepID=A0A0K9PPY3_ZOSMR|nr:hypothetical protein ZOSMA_188G00010 [Zostera marina]